MIRIRHVLFAWFLSFVSLCVSLTVLGAEKNRVNWIKNDLTQALSLAKEQKRDVFLYWSAQWCLPCTILKKNLFMTEAFADAMKPYVPLMIDADSENAAAIGDKYNLVGFPRALILQSDGKMLRVIAPLTEDNILTSLKNRDDAMGSDCAQFIQSLETAKKEKQDINKRLDLALIDRTLAKDFNTSSEECRTLVLYSLDGLLAVGEKQQDLLNRWNRKLESILYHSKSAHLTIEQSFALMFNYLQLQNSRSSSLTAIMKQKIVMMIDDIYNNQIKNDKSHHNSVFVPKLVTLLTNPALNEPKEAERILKETIATGDTNYSLLKNLAIVHFQLGDEKAGLKSLYDSLSAVTSIGGSSYLYYTYETLNDLSQLKFADETSKQLFIAQMVDNLIGIDPKSVANGIGANLWKKIVSQLAEIRFKCQFSASLSRCHEWTRNYLIKPR